MRFVKTVYTITESDGDVEVCVNLTRPSTDIFESFVGVEVYRNDTSLYIPSGVMLASELESRCKGIFKNGIIHCLSCTGFPSTPPPTCRPLHSFHAYIRTYDLYVACVM